ncbi:hypothetical protein BDP27DRAFT_1313945, partial [Rhodocollybia butyracea]
MSLQNLLGERPRSQPIADYLDELVSIINSSSASTPEIKSYPDTVYYNFYALGLSLLFKPVDDYKPKAGLSRSDLAEDKLILESLDIYNIPKLSGPDSTGPRTKAELAFATHPVSSMMLNLVEGQLQVTRESTGKDFVEHLGEPDRKGGGSGPASGSIGIWCEWKKHGLLVEFGGVEATGPQAWERGKDAGWKVITMFLPEA